MCRVVLTKISENLYFWESVIWNTPILTYKSEVHCIFMIHVVTNIFVLSFLQSSLVLFEALCYMPTSPRTFGKLYFCAIIIHIARTSVYKWVWVENFLTRHKHKLWNMELLKHVFHVQMQCSVIIIIIIWCLEH